MKRTCVLTKSADSHKDGVSIILGRRQKQGAAFERDQFEEAPAHLVTVWRVSSSPVLYTPPANPPVLSQEEMTSALATMRVDYDQVKIKDINTSNNPLLNKRRKKAAAGAKEGSTGCQNQ